MIQIVFTGETSEELMANSQGGCKCGRCTRTAESEDSSMASSDLGS